MHNREAPWWLEPQYRECYESFRQHDRFIWQTASVGVVINGALLVSTFALVNSWLVREFILAVSLIYTLVLTFALYKHRYFSEIEQQSLTRMEAAYGTPNIQRNSFPGNNVEYWFSKQPNRLQSKSAHVLFTVGMLGVSVLVLSLLIINPFLRP
ncbi:MAG: hypothetical protein HW384_2259 [Dehalococcoidia bacterium]|nr:hypothetical protein [Dehalococcoidia bacterium]